MHQLLERCWVLLPMVQSKQQQLLSLLAPGTIVSPLCVMEAVTAVIPKNHPRSNPGPFHTQPEWVLQPVSFRRFV